MFEAVSGPKSPGTIRRRGLILSVIPLFATLLLTLGPSPAEAAPKPNSVNLIPTIRSISVQNGGLVAHGVVTAIVKGKPVVVPFSAPVNISLAEDQSAAEAAGCPILDLELGPIHLDILGLVVDTSPICLKITAYEGGGLLGDLLCSVAHLLDGGLSLGDILSGAGVVDPTGAVVLPGLSSLQLTALHIGVVDLLNSALQQLSGAILTAIEELTGRHECAILHLSLGPVDLTLLGLNVTLDDCDGGPVIVDITALTQRGRILGNLLCGLLGGGLITPGLTLQQLLDLLSG